MATTSATPKAHAGPTRRSAHSQVAATAATVDTTATSLRATQVRAPRAMRIASSAGKTGGYFVWGSPAGSNSSV